MYFIINTVTHRPYSDLQTGKLKFFETLEEALKITVGQGRQGMRIFDLSHDIQTFMHLADKVAELTNVVDNALTPS